MAFDEELATRIRRHLEGRDFVERRMFGGLAFMVNGHMACGIIKDQLMVRVGPDAYDTVLRLTHAHQMQFTGKPMRFEGDPDDEDAASDRKVQKVVDTIQGMIDRGLAAREGIFF